MRCHSIAIRLAIVSLLAVVSIGLRAGFADEPNDKTWISPVSLSANVPGLKISPKLFESLLVRTELDSWELEELGVRVGAINEEDLQRVLEWKEGQRAVTLYVHYFDVYFGGATTKGAPKKKDTPLWSDIPKGFIDLAISLGGFDFKKASSLRRSLAKAAEKGDKPEQIAHRTTAYQLLLQARQSAVRKARGHRQLVDALEFELSEREFEQNIGLVVDIRTSATRPTISPLALVTMQCGNVGSGPFVFRERRRTCDEFGVCRIESTAAVKDRPQYKALFEALGDDGRRYLDGCMLTTRMLIDGNDVTQELPGVFTSHIFEQPDFQQLR